MVLLKFRWGEPKFSKGLTTEITAFSVPRTMGRRVVRARGRTALSVAIWSPSTFCIISKLPLREKERERGNCSIVLCALPCPPSSLDVFIVEWGGPPSLLTIPSFKSAAPAAAADFLLRGNYCKFASSAAGVAIDRPHLRLRGRDGLGFALVTHGRTKVDAG